jgi:hypothetical protein
VLDALRAPVVATLAVILMCVLKIYSPTHSFKDYSNHGNLPIYSVYDKGEFRTKTRQCAEFTMSLDVSDKEWNNFSGQVEDAIKFLKQNFIALNDLYVKYAVSNWYLDFPVYSRLNDQIINQNDHLPSELISLAGKLNLGIEMAIYDPNAFKDHS